jgi:hypothetical protein
MDFSECPICEKEYREMMSLIEAKEKYIMRHGYPPIPPMFVEGEEAAVFFPKPKPHHILATIIEDDEESVTLKTTDGGVLTVSPFQLFHLTDPLLEPVH